MTTLLNIVFGLVPTLILAWAIAADERKPEDERVAHTAEDRWRQRFMFVLVYGLWSLTLAMWNWMRSYPLPWIALWAVAGVVALAWCVIARGGGAARRSS